MRACGCNRGEDCLRDRRGIGAIHGEPSAAYTAGWAINLGADPRCDQVAVCTMNG
jgi:hypothetical protein